MRFKPKLEEIISSLKMEPVLLIPKNSGLTPEKNEKNDLVMKVLNNMSIEYKEEVDEYMSNGILMKKYRGEDIPNLVEDYYFQTGARVIGLTGDDLFDEYMLKNQNSIVSIIETIDWYDEDAKYKRPALCYITRKGENPKGKVRIAINKKYEMTSRKAVDEMKDSLGIGPEIIVYNGGLEKTVADGINDACIEIVDTGTSLEKNNLEVKEVIRYSDFVLIGIDIYNPKIFPAEYAQIWNRFVNPKDGSYTSGIILDTNNSIKKLGEEFAELVDAYAQYDENSNNENLKKIIEESMDLWYAMQINLARIGIDFTDITKELYRRYKRD